MTNEHTVISIAVMAAVTALLRFLPFIVFSGKKTPSAVEKFGRVLPLAVMGMLVVYSLKDISFASISGFLPELISVLLVVVSYIIKRSSLLSIGIGTVCYMVLVQTVFK